MGAGPRTVGVSRRGASSGAQGSLGVGLAHRAGPSPRGVSSHGQDLPVTTAPPRASAGRRVLAALPRHVASLADGAAMLVLVLLVGALSLNVVARLAGLPLVGAGMVAAWLFPALAFASLPGLIAPRTGSASSEGPARAGAWRADARPDSDANDGAAASSQGDAPSRVWSESGADQASQPLLDDRQAALVMDGSPNAAPAKPASQGSRDGGAGDHIAAAATDDDRPTRAPAAWRVSGAALVAGFAIATVGLGLVGAAQGVGGTEPVLGIPRAWRYVFGAVFAGLALVTALRSVPAGLGVAAGIFLALLPLPAQVPWVGLAIFAAALGLRAPVALALLAAVAISPGRLSDAALAQNLMRGLSPYVLLAIPLFILSAALMVAGGIGQRLVDAARWFARRRRSALGEANVFVSVLFGGVSGSSVADAAMGARLIVPAMVAAGYRPGRAGAITAASAILPNVLPPSIALLLAAAATDQSVGTLWIAGLGAGLTLAAVLWAAVRLTPVGGISAPAPCASTPNGGSGAAEPGARVLLGLLPPLAIALTVLGGLRLGLVTSVEAGLLAVAMAALFALPAGPRAFAAAVREAAGQSGRVALLIGAAAPVGFVITTSGLDLAALLPNDATWIALAAAAALALAVGTVLDVGAAILLLLPLLVPAIGGDPIHATLVLTVALLMGGLTPPVGVLVLVVKDIAQVDGVYRAITPYLIALAAGLAVLIALPALTSGLASLF